MPARYAGRRSETEAAVKILQCKLISACYECRRGGSDPLTWDVFRTWVTAVRPEFMTDLKQEAAGGVVIKRSEMLVAIGAEEVADRVKARSFSFGAHRIPQAGHGPSSVAGASKDGEPTVADASVPAIRIRWIRSLLPNRKWHFESHQRWLPLCSMRGGRVIAEPREDGISLERAFAGGAPCDKCLAQLPPARRGDLEAFL